MHRYRTVAVLLLLPVLAIACRSSSGSIQPIQYSHKIHIEEAGLTCTDCHQGALTRQKASIPGNDVCIQCHEEPLTESEEENKLRAYLQKNQPIPWKQVHRVPDYAYFSHRRHAGMAGLECQTCHGNVQEMQTPFSKPAFALQMKFCMDCHKETGANIDCVACHR